MNKKDKIFIAGHRGLVGSAILKNLQERGFKNIITKTHKELDLTNQQETARFFNLEKPDYVFFNSVLDLVNGSRTESHYDAIYNGYIDYQRMIRKDGFKLIVYPKLNKLLLFDMKNDPEEMNDLAALPEHGEKVDTMFEELLELQKQMFNIGLISQRDLDELQFEIEQLNYDKMTLLIDGLNIELDIAKLKL